MRLRWLLAWVWLVPQLALGDTFHPADVQRIQQALQILGYPITDADGQWGADTTVALDEYRFNFGMTEGMDISLAEATELLSRAQMFAAPPALVWVDTTSWDTPHASTEAEPSYFSPARKLLASNRHALATEMKMRPSGRPYDAMQSVDPEFRALSDNAGARLRRWLEDDIRRIDAADPVSGLLGRTLVEIDLLLSFGAPGTTRTRDDMSRSLFPRIRLLVDRFPQTQLPADVYLGLNERLVSAMLEALNVSNCYDGRKIDDAWVKLTLDVIGRYEKLRPGAPELMGLGAALVRCADAKTADRLLVWRIGVAEAKGNRDLAFTIAKERMWVATRDGNLDLARAQFYQLFKAATDAQRGDLITSAPIRELGLVDIARPYLVAQVDAMRGKALESNVDLTNAMNFMAYLMKLGFDFEVVDRIITETDNGWRDGDDLIGFYTLMTASMVNLDEFEDALVPLQRLADRAYAEGDIEKAEIFREQQLEALLELGRFSEAEDRIGEFVAMARKGALDPRVAAWQARLNLASDEGQSPGVVYAEQFSTFLDALCQPDAPFPPLPAIDRETVYADPSFLPAAQRLNLSARITVCNTDPYPIRAEYLTRLGCYLWAKEGNLAELTRLMQAWLLEVQDLDRRGSGVILTGNVMDCPMGIAEAGRNDLLAKFMAQIDNASQADGIVLLKLATLQSADYARWVTEWSGTDRSGVHDVDFPSMEALAQLGDPKAAALRQNALGAFFVSYAGANADSKEMAGIRSMSLDLASGYAAMNRDGLAIFFLESAEPNLERAPDADQADVLLSDAETARYFLARGRLALKRGDAATALATVGPVVTAYIDRARLGQAGSIEDLGPWARRLQGFVELYLSALAADPALLAAEAPENILAAQQLLAAADASATSGRLAARLSAVDPDLVRTYQDGLRDLRGAMMAAASGGDFSAVDTKRREVNALRERIKQIDPAFGANTALSIAPLDALRANGAGGATVILTSLPDRLLVSTVTKAAATFQVVDLPRAELVQAIAAFRATILREEDVVTTEGVRLSSAVLSGFGGLPQVPDKINFVIDGPFVSLPFGALPIRVGEKQSYLGAEIPLSMTPSLALLAVRSDAASGKADRPFLGIGDAQFSAVGAQDRLGFVPTELRETNTELRFMGALLGADIAQDLLFGAAATEVRLDEMSKTGDLARYRIIAFATHGFIENQGNLREAGLLLSEPQRDDRNHDGVLSVSEIYRLKLDADLVILSACDTGAVTTGSRGLSDLAQAFIYAGARGLIVTHWEIDTFAATELSKRLATEIRAAPTLNEALAFRDVVRSPLSDPSAKAFHHPKYWASHAVIGL